MDPLISFVALPAACYLCGSVPFGWIAGRTKGIDIREHGSKNVGATNVGRVMGKPWGIAVFVLDVTKGLLPVLAAGAYLREHYHGDERLLHLARVLCAFAAVAGHVWTFWLGFKGGKGVATALGAVVAIWPEFTYAGGVGLAVWLLTAAGTRYVSLASMVGVVGFAAAYFVMAGRAAVESQVPLAAFAVVTAVLIVVKHRSNVGRLMAGTEPKIGSAKERAAEEPKPTGTA
jgi:glycerol-3-phosphate acyltransferase PlsY